MNDLRSSVLRDSVQTFAVRIASVAIAAALGVLTARLLGPEQRGLYVLPTIDAALASAVFGGLASATTYFMLNKRRGRGALRSASLTGIVFVLGGATLVTLLGLLQHRPWTIPPAAAALPSLVVISVVGGYCFGASRVQYANALNVLSVSIGLVMMALGLFLIARDAKVAVTMWLASTTITALIAAAFLWFHSRRLEYAEVHFSEYFSFALKSGLTNVLSVLNLRIDVYIVAALMAPAALGIYTVAVAGAETLKILTLVLSQTAAPRIGSMPRDDSARFTARCIRNNFLTASIPSALIIAAAPWLLEILYGTKFSTGARALQILVVGIFASSPAAILATYYTLRLGRPMVSFWNNVLSASICALLSILFIPRFGMNGAALSSTASYALSQAVLIRLFVTESKLELGTVLMAQAEDLLFMRRAAHAIVRRILGARV